LGELKLETIGSCTTLVIEHNNNNNNKIGMDCAVFYVPANTV